MTLKVSNKGMKMHRIHRDEIKRWADSPYGTGVWCKSIYADNWHKVYTLGWKDFGLYILDDEYAEVRKQMCDDPYFVEVFDKETKEWRQTELEELSDLTMSMR